MNPTTTGKDRDQALAWIARQLRWERTLASLRGERRPEESPGAAAKQAA